MYKNKPIKGLALEEYYNDLTKNKSETPFEKIIKLLKRRLEDTDYKTLKEKLDKGYMPCNLFIKVRHGKEEFNILQIIFKDSRCKFYNQMKLADKIISKNHNTLEQLKFDYESFKPEELFKILSSDSVKLYYYLRKYHEKINEQDKEGNTILHHVVSNLCFNGKTTTYEFFDVIFSTKGLNMDIQNKNGMTVLHLCGYLCQNNLKDAHIIIHELIKNAVDLKTNFELLDNHGQSLIHYISRSYKTSSIFQISLLPHVIDIIKEHFDINVLSSSGSTALFYSLNHCLLDSAEALIEAGADVKKYGNSERKPINQINEYLKRFKDEGYENNKRAIYLIEKLEKIKKMIK